MFRLNLALTAALVSLIPHFLSAQDNGKPPILSDPAISFIQSNEASVLSPNSIDEWQEAAGVIAPNGVLSESGQDWLERYPGQIELVSIDGAEHLMITPDSFEAANKDRLLIYAHGGAYTLGRPEDQLGSVAVIAHLMRQRVLAVRYPLAWQKPFPAARDRLVAVYEEMLETHKPQHIAMAGDSAGGGLVMSAVLNIRESGLPMPAVLGLISPWADISKTGASMSVQDGHDPVISYDKNLALSAALYADGRDLTDPGVSPIYGDFSQGFPPTYISTGTRDLFLSHASRLQRKLTDAGVANSLFVYEGMWHVFQLVPEPAVPEAANAWRDFVKFLSDHLAR